LVRMPCSFLSRRTSFASVRCILSKQFGGRRHSFDARSHGRRRSVRPRPLQHEGGS
jgi:hypothetical protein